MLLMNWNIDIDFSAKSLFFFLLSFILHFFFFLLSLHLLELKYWYWFIRQVSVFLRTLLFSNSSSSCCLLIFFCFSLLLLFISFIFLSLQSCIRLYRPILSVTLHICKFSPSLLLAPQQSHVCIHFQLFLRHLYDYILTHFQHAYNL